MTLTNCSLPRAQFVSLYYHLSSREFVTLLEAFKLSKDTFFTSSAHLLKKFQPFYLVLQHSAVIDVKTIETF